MQISISLNARWQEALNLLPLIAILRGIAPEEASEIGSALFEAGFRIVEVPLNSPAPLKSIEILAQTLGAKALVGAGTVLRSEQVQAVADRGGQIIISPNSKPAVIAATRALGLISMPAFFTASEALSSIDAGAHALKLFPAEMASPAGLKALKAILPRDMPIFPVGGIGPDQMQPYLASGAAGFGIGSQIYRPGDTARKVHDKASAFVQAWAALKQD